MNMLTEIILNDKVTNENIRVQVIRSGRKKSWSGGATGWNGTCKDSGEII